MEITLSTLILTAIIAAIIGGIAGALLFRASRAQQDTRELEDRLQKAEGEFKDYQQQVTDHFSVTAELVNNLTRNYKEVHEYLADSALKLTNADMSRQFLKSGSEALPETENLELSETEVEPPRDWAPKTPGQKGALSEEYGLDEEREDIAAKTVHPV